MHSLVLFTKDVRTASSEFAHLLNVARPEIIDHFAEIPFEPFNFGFHPADEKSSDGSIVAYWQVASVPIAIREAAGLGYDLYRGPLTLEKITIAQVRHTDGTVIGLIEHHE